MFSPVRGGGIQRVLSRGKSTSPASYCVDLVRQYDYENFLCTLLLPEEVRTPAFAIRAFNIEVSKAVDEARTKQLAEGKFAFWNDVLEAIYSKKECPKQPVARELSRAINNYKLPKMHFSRLINCRKSTIDGASFKTLIDMEKYNEESVSPVYYLILSCAGVQNVHADHAASHLGKAQGISNLIRAVPHNARKRCLLFPQEVLVKHSVSTESVYRHDNSKNFEDAVFDVASHAKTHLDKARSLKSKVPKEVSTIFLPAISVGQFLTSLEKYNFNIYDPKVAQRNNLLGWHLFWNKLFHSY